MHVSNTKENIFLFLGDILIFVISLFGMLFFRYLQVPEVALVYSHVIPFSILFVVWVLVFFIAGLYEKHTILLKNKLSSIILNAQIVNSVIAVLFFYFIPYFGITPKTNLFIYLVVSFPFIFAWRLYGFPFLAKHKRQSALLIGGGQDMVDLKREVNMNSRYKFHFVSNIDPDDIGGLDFQEEILKQVYASNIQVVAVDLSSEKIEPVLPHLYNLIFSKIRFIDAYKIYEDIFDRVPLSLVRYNWFLENVSTSPQITYGVLKRVMDVTLALVVGVGALAVFPFVVLAIKLDDKGSVFFYQDRIGENNQPIRIVKFRTMGVSGGGEKDITKVGAFLRKTRIDELPQLWNVLKGDLSMIGPRPEIPTLINQYTKEIPYYSIRHLIKPGLSGWAQLYHENHPHHQSDVVETKVKLSYDLYYVKNRSFVLDVKIALKTLKKIVSRSGL